MFKHTWKIIVLVVSLTAIAGGLSFMSQDQADVTDEQQVPAPDFTLRRLDGERVKLSDLRGKVVLVNFWATWCPPCRREIPDLSRIHTDYEEQGLVVLGISWDELTADEIKDFADNYKMTYPILYGTQSELIQVGRAYNWEGYLPTTYVIDREGNLVDTYIGARNEEFFLEGIEPLL